jgi:hypothetical protein
MGGGIVGGIGVMAGVFGSISEVGDEYPITLLFLTPLFTIFGAVCGYVSYKHGWTTVGPLASAFLGGIITNIFNPLGWAIGGAIGGGINGIRVRSLGTTVKRAVIGACLGLVGPTVMFAYGWILCVVF